MPIDVNLVLAVSIVIAVAAFAFAFWLYRWVVSIPIRSERVGRIRSQIAAGARTFLKREYRLLTIFTIVVTILIVLFLPKPIWSGAPMDNIGMAISYILGTLLSALAGWVGVIVATQANARSAEAAQDSIGKSFLAGFRGGAVMGMAVVGASLLGVAAIFWILGDSQALFGFSFGASTLALFAKAGGGIFTKTADISADLVGKVEFDLAEDDPRNPAVIADNVGDNVGDVAGMGADLFDSNVAAMVAALVLALSIGGVSGKPVLMVFVFAGLGLFASILGVGFAKMGQDENPSRALNLANFITIAVYLVLTLIFSLLFDFEMRLWGSSMIGLAAGVVIGITSDYFTNDARPPVRKVAELSQTGPAFTIISGIAYGLLSVLPALVGIAIASLFSYLIASPLGESYALFGIAMAALGMLSIVGTIISNDAYGPIVDNARGLVEMADLGEDALERTDSLDSAGNTVKAITKGFSIGAAGLTVIALLGAFMTEVNIAAVAHGLREVGEEYLTGFDIMDPLVFFGLLVGAAIPAIFSAQLMLGVNRNADRMVAEIHRQFREIPGLKEGKEGVEPDSNKCIAIATDGALKELMPVGATVILITLAVGFIGGVSAIGGFLAGNIVSGMLLAIFMSNAGGLWDNGKKYIESGEFGGKGSDAHKAGVIGDTVGDPFKDTAGPSINTQITVCSLVASICAEVFLLFSLFG